MEQVTPWTQVVSLLSHGASDEMFAEEPWHVGCRSRSTSRAGKPRGAHEGVPGTGCTSKITSIERQDKGLALVSWCDPTMCHYVDQVWNQVVARSSGYCALTGQRIERGDTIFKPRARGRNRPANCNEMILAVALAQA
jgi:hypothetical protein